MKLDDGKVQKKIDEIEDVINQYYLNDADVERVETQLYKGLVKGLEDPYSNYYTKKRWNSCRNQMQVHTAELVLL